MKTEIGGEMTAWEFLHNLWYRWEAIRVESSGGSIFTHEPRFFRTKTQVTYFRALRVAVYDENWWIRRSTLPWWYWKLTGGKG